MLCGSIGSLFASVTSIDTPVGSRPPVDLLQELIVSLTIDAALFLSHCNNAHKLFNLLFALVDNGVGIECQANDEEKPNNY